MCPDIYYTLGAFGTISINVFSFFESGQKLAKKNQQNLKQAQTKNHWLGNSKPKVLFNQLNFVYWLDTI